MSPRLIGALLLGGMCVALGFTAAGRLGLRCRLLRAFMAALERMRTELEVHQTPLPALLAALERDRPELAGFFREVREHWGADYLAFPKAWSRALESVSVTAEDRLLLGEVGRLLGRYDAETQIQGLNRTLLTLEEQYRDAQELKKKNQQIFQVLGTAGGLAVVILLL